MLPTLYRNTFLLTLALIIGGCTAPEMVTLAPISGQVLAGDDFQFTASSTRENTNSYSWASSNTQVAQVNNAGLVTGVAPGSATITATSVPGNTMGKATITVLDPLEQTITFPDAPLLGAIRSAIDKPSGAIKLKDLVGTGFTRLDAAGLNIQSLSGLEHCTDLTELDLHGNCISNITPLASLAQLHTLNLHDNQIASIAPLVGLTALDYLWLSQNTISDVSPLVLNAGIASDDPTHPDRVRLDGNLLQGPETEGHIATLNMRGVETWLHLVASESKSLNQTLRSLKGMEPCAAMDLPGDPIPISARLIHGDPTIPDSQAYVLLVLGDGFTTLSQGDPAVTAAAFDGDFIDFAPAAADTTAFLFTEEPFAEYASYFKVYRVDLFSRDGSLTDLRTDPVQLRDTALGMAQENVGYDYDIERVHRVADNTGIAWDRVVLIPNGDSSGTFQDDVLVFSNRRVSRRQTGLHEFGHSIGYLADEYEYRHGTSPPTPLDPAIVDDEPNIVSMGTMIPTFEQIPWNHWLDPGEMDVCLSPLLGSAVDFDCDNSMGDLCQCEEIPVDPQACIPLPTCEPGGNFVDEEGVIFGRPEWPVPGDPDSVIGLFEGAKYRSKGFYRPELRCRMRSVDDVAPPNFDTNRFCTVCREALVEEIVHTAGHVAMVTPSTDLPIPFTPDSPVVEFEIVLHQLATPEHDREISNWYVDGEEQVNTSGLTFDLEPATLSENEQHTISVTIHDLIPWVHPANNDGQQKISQTLTWTLMPDNG